MTFPPRGVEKYHVFLLIMVTAVSGCPVWPKWNTTNADGVGTNIVFDADGGNNTETHTELDNYRLAQTQYINSIWQSQLNY